MSETLANVRVVEAAMARHALLAWSTASAREGCTDHEALLIYADALARWSERIRMALDGRLDGDEDWLNFGEVTA